MNETKELAQRCLQIQSRDFTAEITDRVRYFLLDFLGVVSRGAQTESGLQVQRAVTSLHPNPEARGVRLIGTGLSSNPALAALANGTAAHSLELDDVVNAASLHPGVVILPAVLAAAEHSRSSMVDVFEAIVIGYEVMIRIGIAVNPAAHYRQGFHPTGTCGVFGAAAAVGRILNLNARQLISALGIAGSQASGSLEFLSDGAYTKRFHAGWAAQAGLSAAYLAKEGFSGPGTILEGPFGFFQAYSQAADASLLFKDWGDPYALMRTSIKPHACCRYKQGPIDGILQIMQANDLQAEDVDSVRTAVLEAGYALVAEPLDQKQHPQRVVEAQFSMPFGAAVAMHFGKAGLDQYQEEIIQLPVIQELMKRVSCEKDPDLDREFPQKWPARVSLTTKQGQSFSVRVDFPKGDPENPLTWDELTQKFHDLTSPVFNPQTRKNIVNTVRSLSPQDSLDKLTRTLDADEQARKS